MTHTDPVYAFVSADLSHPSCQSASTPHAVATNPTWTVDFPQSPVSAQTRTDGTMALAISGTLPLALSPLSQPASGTCSQGLPVVRPPAANRFDVLAAEAAVVAAIRLRRARSTGEAMGSVLQAGYEHDHNFGVASRLDTPRAPQLPSRIQLRVGHTELQDGEPEPWSPSLPQQPQESPPPSGPAPRRLHSCCTRVPAVVAVSVLAGAVNGGREASDQLLLASPAPDSLARRETLPLYSTISKECEQGLDCDDVSSRPLLHTQGSALSSADTDDGNMLIRVDGEDIEPIEGNVGPQMLPAELLGSTAPRDIPVRHDSDSDSGSTGPLGSPGPGCGGSGTGNCEGLGGRSVAACPVGDVVSAAGRDSAATATASAAYSRAVSRYGSLLMSSAGWRHTELFDMCDDMALLAKLEARSQQAGAGGGAAALRQSSRSVVDSACTTTQQQLLLPLPLSFAEATAAPLAASRRLSSLPHGSFLGSPFRGSEAGADGLWACPEGDAPVLVGPRNAAATDVCMAQAHVQVLTGPDDSDLVSPSLDPALTRSGLSPSPLDPALRRIASSGRATSTGVPAESEAWAHQRCASARLLTSPAVAAPSLSPARSGQWGSRGPLGRCTSFRGARGVAEQEQQGQQGHGRTASPSRCSSMNGARVSGRIMLAWQDLEQAQGGQPPSRDAAASASASASASAAGGAAAGWDATLQELRAAACAPQPPLHGAADGLGAGSKSSGSVVSGVRERSRSLLSASWRRLTGAGGSLPLSRSSSHGRVHASAALEPKWLDLPVDGSAHSNPCAANPAAAVQSPASSSSSAVTAATGSICTSPFATSAIVGATAHGPSAPPPLAAAGNLSPPPPAAPVHVSTLLSGGLHAPGASSRLSSSFASPSPLRPVPPTHRRASSYTPTNGSTGSTGVSSGEARPLVPSAATGPAHPPPAGEPRGPIHEAPAGVPARPTSSSGRRTAPELPDIGEEDARVSATRRLSRAASASRLDQPRMAPPEHRHRRQRAPSRLGMIASQPNWAPPAGAAHAASSPLGRPAPRAAVPQVAAEGAPLAGIGRYGPDALEGRSRSFGAAGAAPAAVSPQHGQPPSSRAAGVKLLGALSPMARSASHAARTRSAALRGATPQTDAAAPVTATLSLSNPALGDPQPGGDGPTQRPRSESSSRLAPRVCLVSPAQAARRASCYEVAGWPAAAAAAMPQRVAVSPAHSLRRELAGEGTRAEAQAGGGPCGLDPSEPDDLRIEEVEELPDEAVAPTTANTAAAARSMCISAGAASMGGAGDSVCDLIMESEPARLSGAAWTGGGGAAAAASRWRRSSLRLRGFLRAMLGKRGKGKIDVSTSPGTVNPLALEPYSGSLEVRGPRVERTWSVGSAVVWPASPGVSLGGGGGGSLASSAGDGAFSTAVVSCASPEVQPRGLWRSMRARGPV